MNASNEQAAKRLFNQGDCTTAKSNLAAISMVEKAPNTFELKHGGKVATEAEKAAARAESEKFIKENCR